MTPLQERSRAPTCRPPDKLAMNEPLTDLVSQATGLPPAATRVSPRPPLSVQSNRLYDAWAGGRHLILKEYLKEPEFQDAPRREFDALQLLAPLDVAPRPVFRQPPTPPLGPVVLYEYMEGETWDRRRPSAAELARLAHVWLRINAVPAEGLWMSRGYEQPLDASVRRFRAIFTAYRSWAETEHPQAQHAADMCLELLRICRPVVRELADCDPPLCFCRSDPRFANVIARPDGRLGLVDWEDSGLRDAARDLADIVLHPNQENLYTTDEWRAFAEPYVAGRSEHSSVGDSSGPGQAG
jgi:aminoglycoside phosphotransferase (APT) family kinase protein